MTPIIMAASPTGQISQLGLGLLDFFGLAYFVLFVLTAWNAFKQEHGETGRIRTPVLLFFASLVMKWLVSGWAGWALACLVLLTGLLVSRWRGRRYRRQRKLVSAKKSGGLDALVITFGHNSVQRMCEPVGRRDLQDRTLEFASGIGTSWDVVIAGDNLDALEDAALRSLNGPQSLLWRVWCAIRGVRGTGLRRLVGELGLAADHAAGFHEGSLTSFAFRDPTLGNALAIDVVSTRREPGIEIVALVANPGYLFPRRRG